MEEHNKVTIIMYHYVRDLKSSRFPRIKGLDLALFAEQIKYIRKNYHVIKIEELAEAIHGDLKLPAKAVLLTFDDAYIDHYINVFPILEKNKLQGSFYIPVKAVAENLVLDVNKIHFLLASSCDEKMIIKEIFQQLDKYRTEYNIKGNDYYYEKLARPNRFDTAEVVFIKRILQREIHAKLRSLITDYLFRKYVSSDETSFCNELYMSREQIMYMNRNGMHIGNHGYDHVWLGELDKKEQELQIEKSMSFMEEVSGARDFWTMSYPYGSYNQDTLSVIQKKGCKLAFTSSVNVADIKAENKFELSRLDTNDIPMKGGAEINDWYFRG